ncbi:hypothetical protein HDU76_002660, partial [Blyttiomyces sp. JEL0837]
VVYGIMELARKLNDMTGQLIGKLKDSMMELDEPVNDNDMIGVVEQGGDDAMVGVEEDVGSKGNCPPQATKKQRSREEQKLARRKATGGMYAADLQSDVTCEWRITKGMIRHWAGTVETNRKALAVKQKFESDTGINMATDVYAKITSSKGTDPDRILEHSKSAMMAYPKANKLERLRVPNNFRRFRGRQMAVDRAVNCIVGDHPKENVIVAQGSGFSQMKHGIPGAPARFARLALECLKQTLSTSANIPALQPGEYDPKIVHVQCGIPSNVLDLDLLDKHLGQQFAKEEKGNQTKGASDLSDMGIEVVREGEKVSETEESQPRKKQKKRSSESNSTKPKTRGSRKVVIVKNASQTHTTTSSSSPKTQGLQKVANVSSGDAASMVVDGSEPRVVNAGLEAGAAVDGKRVRTHRYWEMETMGDVYPSHVRRKKLSSEEVKQRVINVRNKKKVYRMGDHSSLSVLDLVSAREGDGRETDPRLQDEVEKGEVGKPIDEPLWEVKRCFNCGMIHRRDMSAAFNIAVKFLFQHFHNNNPPFPFNRFRTPSTQFEANDNNK